MPDEPVMIEALAGPYAGARLTVTAAEAKQAIADGWARDPFAEPTEPQEMTDEKRLKIAEAAEKAARKLRGEEDAEPKKPAAKETKSMEAEAPAPAATYQTKSKK